MKVYKFGGASVKDSEGIRNLTKIVAEESDNLVIVISAFGKTTNALEKVLKAWISGKEDYPVLLDEVYVSHLSVISDLFGQESEAKKKIDLSFSLLRDYLMTSSRAEYDFEYDQIVCYGEIWSTIVVSEFLKSNFSDVRWYDIRAHLLTDDRYRDANVLWYESTRKLQNIFNFRQERIYVTQGFIGGTVTGYTTTLGREGSDYTAAIIGNILDASEVIIWKDVPGILNADPKWLPDASKLDEISYKEAVEMSFSGAKVIHPKTIKPLHNKSIPLNVRSFINPHECGTIIKADATLRKILPVFIKKEEQLLVSILPRDFSFVMGDNLSRIFHTFITFGIKVNLVEASAVSIDVCIDDERAKVDALLTDLKTEFTTVYNELVELLTIRHYTPESLVMITNGREILLEQKTRSTVRYVVRKMNHAVAL
jgi:aspartate kinase